MHLNFILRANHNLIRLKKSITNLIVAIAFLLILTLVSGYYSKDVTNFNNDINISDNIFGYSIIFLIAFIFFLLLVKYGQDIKNPAFGVTNQGVFVNQQYIRNTFVPWKNIEQIDLKGHKDNIILYLKIKNCDELLKGHFFVFKTLAKVTLKSNKKIRISQDESQGDLLKMYEIIKERL